MAKNPSRSKKIPRSRSTRSAKGKKPKPSKKTLRKKAAVPVSAPVPPALSTQPYSPDWLGVAAAMQYAKEHKLGKVFWISDALRLLSIRAPSVTKRFTEEELTTVNEVIGVNFADFIIGGEMYQAYPATAYGERLVGLAGQFTEDLGSAYFKIRNLPQDEQWTLALFFVLAGDERNPHDVLSLYTQKAWIEYADGISLS